MTSLQQLRPRMMRARSLRAFALCSMLYLALAAAWTWPLATRLGAAIPLGTEEVATVPLFNLWTLGWNAEQLRGGFGERGYWDAPIFHPTSGAFAFSEPQPLTGVLAAPLFWAGFPALAYNTMLFAILVLNGLMAWRLLFGAGLGPLPSILGGALAVTLPFAMQELGVLQLVWLAGMLWSVDAFARLARAPSPRRGAMLGLALAATALTCAYYALFLGLVLAAAGWLFVEDWRRRELWTSLAAAGAVASVLVAPLAVGQLSSGDGMRRSEKTVARHSAQPEHYMRAAWAPRIPLPGVETAERPGSRAFFPGTLKLLLASGGTAWAWRRGGMLRRFAAFCTLSAAVAWTLSLGPNLDLGALSPYGILAAVVPGLGQLRSLFRFAVVVQLAVVLLAAVGLHAVARATDGTAPQEHRARLALALLLGGLAVGELWPGAQKLQALPPLDTDMAWLEWIERETLPDDVLAFVPFPRGGGSDAYQGTAQWMYWALRHQRPMVNGYSGFFPRSFLDLKKAMASFPDAASLELLRRHEVRYAVVLRAFSEPAELETRAGGALVRVAEDARHGIDIYALVQSGIASFVPEGRRRVAQEFIPGNVGPDGVKGPGDTLQSHAADDGLRPPRPGNESPGYPTASLPDDSFGDALGSPIR